MPINIATEMQNKSNPIDKRLWGCEICKIAYFGSDAAINCEKKHKKQKENKIILHCDSCHNDFEREKQQIKNGKLCPICQYTGKISYLKKAK